MLDLLRERPRSTGDLAAEFEFTRFGTMKHLKVLAAAGLITVERRSRERINHLNAVPIQQIYRRWIRPFEAAPADALLQLKRVAEQPNPSAQRTDKTMLETNKPSLTVHEIRLEVDIDASAERVWTALTDEIGRWWPKSFCVGGARRFTLEPKVGGRMFEDWEGGEGLLWGTVVQLKKHARLDLAGDTFPEYGGAGRHLSSYILEEGEGSTKVRFVSTSYGNLTEGSGKDLEGGWKHLLETCFAAYVEGRPQTDPPVVA